LPRGAEADRAGARKVRGLVFSTARDIPVHPVLVLSGPGMPAVGALTVREGVKVANSTSGEGWEQLLAQGKAVSTLGEARQAADVLVRMRDTHVAYEGRRARATPILGTRRG